MARLIALVVGGFYVAVGAWAFVVPAAFYDSVATFAPFNRHLMHDAGAFQVGLGLALVVPAAMRLALRPGLLAVLGGSLLHLLSHVEDSQLGGHPLTDFPVLGLICLVLVIGIVLDSRAGHTAAPPRATS